LRLLPTNIDFADAHIALIDFDADPRHVILCRMTAMFRFVSCALNDRFFVHSLRRVSVLSIALLAAGCSTLDQTQSRTAARTAPTLSNDPTKWTIEIASHEPKLSGRCRIYDEFHRVMAEGSIADDKMDGAWTFTASDGTPIVESSYRSGVRDGPVTMWFGRWRYPDAVGKVKLQGVMVNGNYEGQVTRYDHTGVKQSVRTYEGGVLKNAQWWDGPIEAPPKKALEESQLEHQRDMQYFQQLESVFPIALEKARRVVVGR
jgi:hypothetical protein